MHILWSWPPLQNTNIYLYIYIYVYTCGRPPLLSRRAAPVAFATGGPRCGRHNSCTRKCMGLGEGLHAGVAAAPAEIVVPHGTIEHGHLLFRAF